MIRILLYLIITTITTLAHTASYQLYNKTCLGDNVYVPCEPKSWSFASDLLIMNEWEGKSTILSDVSPMVQAGFRLEGTYEYTKSNQLKLNWSRYDAKTGLGATLYYNATQVFARGTVNYRSHFDIINLDFGQKVALSERMDWRLFAGLEYAYLSDKLSAEQGILNVQQPTSWITQVNGVGPRAGTMSVFYLDEGVSIFAESAISVLNAKSTTNVDGGTVNGICNNSDQGVRYMMITQVEAQMGMIYEKLISQGEFSFRGGWETHNFINAIVGSNDSNMAWQGGFVGLRWLSLA